MHFCIFCNVSSAGSTNRRYLQEDKFLDQTIIVPKTIEEQEFLSELLDKIASIARIQELDLARLQKRSPVCLQFVLHLVFGGQAQEIDSEQDNVLESTDSMRTDDDPVLD